MENEESKISNNKKIKIVCAVIGIFLIIVTVIIYNFIYDNSQKEIVENNEPIVEEPPVIEIDWTIYKGKQDGANVRNLINDLMRYGNFNKAEKDKVVKFEFLKDGESIKIEYEGEEKLINYLNDFNNLYSKIDTSHEYSVELVYDETNTQVKLIKVSY